MGGSERVVFFTFGLYLLAIVSGIPEMNSTYGEYVETKAFPQLDSFEIGFLELFNSTAMNKLPDDTIDSITDFIKTVRQATNTIQSEIEFHASQMSKIFDSQTSTLGAKPNDFLFAAAAVKESVSQVWSTMNNVIRKVNLIGAEKNVRQLAAKLTGKDNNTTIDIWFKSKAGEISEEVQNLKVHFSELSESYQSYLISLKALRRRLAVVASYDLLDRYRPVVQICHDGMFVCKYPSDKITCVKYCNGSRDCEDGSDEPEGCKPQLSAT